MKVWKTGWNGVPGKRLALPSLLAGCLLGCANFSVVDANGRFTSFPTQLASSDLGAADANVPARIPTGNQPTARPGTTIGRAPRVPSTSTPVTPEKQLTGGAPTAPAGALPPKSMAAKPTDEVDATSFVDLVEEVPEGPGQTTPPFALPKPAPVVVENPSSATSPPFPDSSHTSVQPTGTLTIPPPPLVVRKESSQSVKADPPTQNAEEMEVIDLFEEEPAPIVSAEEFDAQLTVEKAPLPPKEVNAAQGMSASPAPSKRPEPATQVELAVAHTNENDDVVELVETDLSTLRSSVEQPPVAQTLDEVVAAEAVPSMRALESPTPPPSGVEGTVADAGLFEVSGLRFCRQITGFGQTDLLPPEQLQAGRMVLLYAELGNFHAEKTANHFTTKLISRINIESSSGEVLQTLEFADIEDRCESKRTDFFCHYTFHLPETLSPGNYVLRLKVKDVLGGEVAERTMDFAIATPQLAKGR